MKKLWLDDNRPRPDETWDVARGYHQFISYIINRGVPDLISFDNDLGGVAEGYDCAKWLVANGYIIKDFQVHSANPVAKENITILLNNWKKFKGYNQDEK